MNHDKRRTSHDQRGTGGDTDDRNNRSSTSPAHWQGEPLPRNAREQTQDIGFDERGTGRASQYGRAGDYGQAHQTRESRPQRGAREPDEALLDDVRDIFRQSGLDIANIVVSADKGVIRLDGSVPDRDDKYALERLAVNCSGVIAVENRLETEPR